VFKNNPPLPPPDGTEYIVRIAINEQLLADRYCTLSPMVIDTEPPHHILECPPQTIFLTPDDSVDLQIIHVPTEQVNEWPTLMAEQFLSLTATSVTIDQSGAQFPGWDGQSFELTGFDIFAPDLPGSDYF
jgi:hypothetical protein